MSRLIAVIGLAILVLAGASAVNAAFLDAGDPNTIENESFAPSAGINTFNHSEKTDVTYDDAADIEITHNGSVVSPSGNYSWVQQNGTADVTDNSYLANQSSAEIDYGWTAHTEQQQEFAAMFGNGLDVAQILIFVILVGFLLTGIRVLGGL